MSRILILYYKGQFLVHQNKLQEGMLTTLEVYISKRDKFLKSRQKMSFVSSFTLNAKEMY